MALSSARAVALMMAMALQLTAAVAAAPPPAPAPAPQLAPIGQLGCNTTCGNVSVPYPFGFGPSHCYWPGLNLTCDTSDDSDRPPRLLLGDDGSLLVTEISLSNRTVRVMGTGSIINTTGDLTSAGWNASVLFGRGVWEQQSYLLSAQNDLVVTGCNVMATIWAYLFEQQKPTIVGGCSSFCSPSDVSTLYGNKFVPAPGDQYCTGTSLCCAAPLTTSGVPVPNGVRATWLNTGNNHTEDQTSWPGIVFVVEHGWVDKEHEIEWHFEDAPLLLDFALTQGLPPHQELWNSTCSKAVEQMICKSDNSVCELTGPGYTCQCEDGYAGNPYLVGGCQDINECKFSSEKIACFGVCINKNASYACQCPLGTYGEPGVQGGCVNHKYNKDTRLPTVFESPTVMMPSCNITCGDVTVPYPFGFGQPDCYLPGFNLTCDTRHSPPRLLLDRNGTLQVVHISLHNSTVHVVHHHGPQASPDWTPNWTTEGDEVRLPDISEPYMLSAGNELIVIAPCNTRAYLHGEYRNGSNDHTNSIMSQVVCGDTPAPTDPLDSYCSGHAPISAGSTAKRVEFKINSSYIPVVFISESGLADQWNKLINTSDQVTYRTISSPIVLQWAVKQGLLAPAAANLGKCPGEVVNQLCKSEHSDCWQENGGYTCHCSKGYDGNPYIVGGCQDIDECQILEKRNSCLGGFCYNLPGDYECRCQQGTHGNASMSNGCFPTTPKVSGLTIGLLAASGPVLLLLVLGIFFLLRKMKQHRIKVQKQKYFKQNRGQLLQQLVSQKADIAERMIIPWDELVKATNNFDRAREIGGGGHGTVYKGILSDLHVVAIKKSKVTKRKEIDEFINEVAILSQINHKNVVKLFGCCLETEVPLLVYEFIPNGTLYQHLHVEVQERSLSWSHRLRIATEIATSLAYLHSSVSIPIIHRDIKSSNILLDDTMTSKISDFGASRYIPIDNKGSTTRIQGTFGYLDPECFHTGRLTEKSDVYSFGVILVELLTRKKPTSSDLSNDYGGLVPHFLNLLASGNLVQIMDPQVLEEGGTEVQQVVTLAASCINIRGDERPTMRQAEHILEGLQQGSNKKYKKDDIVTVDFENGSIWGNCSSWTREGHKLEESSRRYSLEQEMMMSARYPR